MSNEPEKASRRTFLKVGAGVVGGLVVGAAAAYVAKPSTTSTQTTTETMQGSGTTSTVTGPTTTVTGPTTTVTGQGTTVTSTNTVTDTATQTVTNTSTSTVPSSSQTQAYQILSIPEQAELAAIASAIIPTDSNGPGATTAGVSYFVDNQLNGQYGRDGSVFTGGPFVLPNSAGPLTVDGMTYTGGTVTYKTANGTSWDVTYPATTDVRISVGSRYQYPLSKRDFWRVGLAGVEAYSNAAYGANFEKLTAAQQTQVLTDLWSNKPTSAQFQNIQPADFAFEMFYFVWAGYLMDPMWGGNQGMVGWEYLAFNGVNMGNFYGEGHTDKELMLATTPVRLKPASLGMYQRGS